MQCCEPKPQEHRGGDSVWGDWQRLPGCGLGPDDLGWVGRGKSIARQVQHSIRFGAGVGNGDW